MLEDLEPKIRKWFVDHTSDDTRSQLITDKLGYEEWQRLCDRYDLIGVWEVEQLSEITGDESTTR